MICAVFAASVIACSTISQEQVMQESITSIIEVARDPIWDPLAECESGNWFDGGRDFEYGSARWDWGAPGMQLPPWGTNSFHGGLQFHPNTWNWVAPMVGLGHIQFAYEATREEQIMVGEKVQELQGWKAWPVCSRKVGLR